MNFAQRVLGRLICCKSYAEAETIILNAAIVMTTPKTDYDLKKAITNIEQTVNNIRFNQKRKICHCLIQI